MDHSTLSFFYDRFVLGQSRGEGRSEQPSLSRRAFLREDHVGVEIGRQIMFDPQEQAAIMTSLSDDMAREMKKCY